MPQINEQTADYQLADLSPVLKAANSGNTLLENLPVWLSAQTRKSAGRGRSASNTLQYGVQKLRELILELAVRGKLVPQDSNDEPASILLEKVAEEKARLVKEGKIKKPKLFNDVAPEEQPYLLPTGWQWVRLGLITEANTGFAFKSSEYREHGVLVLRVTNINSDGTINTQDAKFIEPLDAQEKYENFALNEDDVLLVMVGGSLGKIGIIPSDILPAVLNQNMWKLTRFGSIFRDYFVYGLKYINNNLLEITSSTHGHLAQGEYLSKPFPLPPLAEQHRIVKKVDELMALCDQLEQQQFDAVQAHDTLVKVLLETLTQSENAKDFQQNWRRIAEHFDTLFNTESSIDQLKQVLLQLAVMGKLVSQDPNHEPASVLLKKPSVKERSHIRLGRGVEANLDKEIGYEEQAFSKPYNWEWTRLGKVLKVEGGSQPPKSVFINTPKPGYTRLIQIRDFKSDEYPTYVPDQYANRPFNSEEIMIGRYGPPVFQILRGKSGTYNVALMKAIPVSGTIYNDYLFHLLSEPRIQQKVVSESERTAGQSGVRKELIYMFPICLPPLAEQHRIVKKVDELMALCDQLKERLNQAQTLQQQLADAVCKL